jgi:endonuclease YncB( thermonuclease family)
VVFLAAAPVDAAESPPFDGLASGGRSKVVEIVDGDTLALEDGREVRLVGIQAPKLPLGRKGFVAWPLADEAKAALAELTMGRPVALFFGGRRGDRHGRTLAHLRDAAGRWVQGEMLSRGLARVYSFFDNRALIAEMLTKERRARRARRGIWADPFYAVRAPGEAGRHIGGFEIVEGAVLAAEVKGRRAYLNFGPDWKSDFTVTLDAKALRRFAESGIDPVAYEGRRVRVRGWLKSYNGPMIEVSHPEQIEEANQGE